MDVFHGSYTKINKIDLSKAQINRDFGQGFYVTKIQAHTPNLFLHDACVALS
jgi:hypothetical protein